MSVTVVAETIKMRLVGVHNQTGNVVNLGTFNVESADKIETFVDNMMAMIKDNSDTFITIGPNGFWPYNFASFRFEVVPMASEKNTRH